MGGMFFLRQGTDDYVLTFLLLLDTMFRSGKENYEVSVV